MITRPLFFQKLTVPDKDTNRVQDNIKRMVGEMNEIIDLINSAIAAVTSSGVPDGDKGDVVVSVGGTVWLIDAAYTAAVLASALAAAPVVTVTAGAGLINSGTSANPVVDAVAGDATLVVAANSLKVGVISSANIDSTIATPVTVAASTLTVDQRLTDLERRYWLLLQRHVILFDDVPPGLEGEIGVAMSIQ